MGYYFWESRSEDAHDWGRRQRHRYPKGYVICECELVLAHLLDLGHPYDLDALRQLDREMTDCGRIEAGLSVSELIQWLRDLDDPDIFAYDSVRIQDVPASVQREERVFNPAQPGKMLIWNTRYIICTFSRSEPVVASCRVVFPEHYRQSGR